MTFLPYNQDVDATVKEIMIKIRVAMNGVTSELMSDRGVKYKTNFGVAFPDLQKIAQQYSPNELVATYLWHKSVRETKILAILLYPAQALTLEKSITWISDCDTVELIEYLCAHLVVFTPFVPTLITQLARISEEKQIIAAYTLAAHYCKRNKPELTEEFSPLLSFSSIHITAKLAQSMLYFLLYAYQKNEFKENIINEMQNLKKNQSENHLAMWLYT
ncbi:MAG TPA: DNA alkylation repair protein, partial [Paludibacteraceae bacterium]|nr:DNA alkylation repair protein [Paludibacteraceae bacterium]